MYSIFRKIPQRKPGEFFQMSLPNFFSGFRPGPGDFHNLLENLKYKLSLKFERTDNSLTLSRIFDHFSVFFIKGLNFY